MSPWSVRQQGRLRAGLPFLMILGSACSSDSSPSWVELANLPETSVRFEIGADGVVELGALEGKPARLRIEESETWLELEFADTDWSTVAPEGSWLAELPHVLTPGTSPLVEDPENGERLLAPGRQFATFGMDPAQFIESRNVFLRIEQALQLRLPTEEEPPSRAHFGWRTTYGYRTDDRFRISGRNVSGDGFAVPPGTSCEVTLDLPPASQLVFATSSETLLRTPASDGDAGSQQRFQVRLGEDVLFQHEQAATESGTVIWHTLELPKNGRENARLVFEVEGALAYSSFLSPSVGPADLGDYRERPWGTRRPDLVVFLADTLRADSLSAYDTGFRPEGLDLTPELDRFVEDSRAFTSARSVGTWTLPSISTIVTGLFPHQTGTDDLGSALPEDVSTLAELLQQRGYRTVAITEGGFVSKQHGFTRGFSAFCEGPTELEETLSKATDALGADDGRPLFLVVHTFRAHGPYFVSPESRERVGGTLGLTENDTWETHWRPQAGEPSPETIEKLKNLYLGGIADLDLGFGAFRDDLERHGLLDSGYLLFTSDHGESFDEHGALLHTGAPHEELVRVPLVLHGPKIVPGLETAPASLIDIAPTLLGLAGLPASPEHVGISLFELSADRPTYSFECAAPGSPSRVAVVESDRKVMSMTEGGILSREVHAAYDLASDPRERQNLDSEQVLWTKELFERHADILSDYLIPRFLTTEASLDPVHRAELEALGYIGG